MIDIKTREDGLHQIGNCWVGKLDEVDIIQIRQYETLVDVWGCKLTEEGACARIDAVLSRTASFKLGKFSRL